MGDTGADDVSCQQVIEFLGEYLSGELSLGERLRFEAHLVLCRHCREYLASYRQTILLAKEWGAEGTEEACESIPEDLIKAILAARNGEGAEGAGEDDV